MKQRRLNVIIVYNNKISVFVAAVLVLCLLASSCYNNDVFSLVPPCVDAATSATAASAAAAAGHLSSSPTSQLFYTATTTAAVVPRRLVAVESPSLKRQRSSAWRRRRRLQSLDVVASTGKRQDENDDDSSSSSLEDLAVLRRGGGGGGGGKKTPVLKSTTTTPSIYWAVFHNWMYFLSLGFNLINVPFMIRSIVDGNIDMKNRNPSPQAIALSGKVESVDKFLTFLGVGFLSALSDKFGRKPLMAWSAIGFMLTNIIQAQTKSNIAMLYLADVVDGCSSCMLPLCQAYVTDCSLPSQRAANLGIFQGLSAGGAFIFAFPIGGILGAKFGPRVPLLAAAALQLINALVIIFITPESNTKPTTKLDLKEANPVGGMIKLFCHSHLLRIASMAYFLASLSRGSLDAQFANYSSIRFGWTQAQSGPILVLVGLMLAIMPRIFVPILGLKNAILFGLLFFSMGLTATGLAPTPLAFGASIILVSIGCICLPALQALLANLAEEGERGALLGAVGSITELTGSIGSTLYAVVLAKYTSDHAPLPIPGMHFLVGAAMLLIAFTIAFPGLSMHKTDEALAISARGSVESSFDI